MSANETAKIEKFTYHNGIEVAAPAGTKAKIRKTTPTRWDVDYKFPSHYGHPNYFGRFDSREAAKARIAQIEGMELVTKWS